MEDMTREEAIRQMEAMIKETEELAAYFHASSSLGGTVPIPCDFLIKLGDCLAATARAMRNIIEKV